MLHALQCQLDYIYTFTDTVVAGLACWAGSKVTDTYRRTPQPTRIDVYSAGNHRYYRLEGSVTFDHLQCAFGLLATYSV